VRFVLAVVLASPLALADARPQQDAFTIDAPLANCYDFGAPGLGRVLKYAELAMRHRVSGLASYYSAFFDGRKTANGEIYRNRQYSAAHLTLPLGTWIEVTSRATGKKLRMRVNDRGPYVKKFCIDLSRAAAKDLGLDVAHDRRVSIRIIGLPGEVPLPE